MAPPVQLHDRLRQLPGRFQRFLRRWSLGANAKEKIAQWQELDQTGADLATIMASPAWASIEEAKRFYQEKHEACVRTPSMSEDARLKSAIELATLDGFFRELRNRVREGQKAREALAKVQPKTS